MILSILTLFQGPDLLDPTYIMWYVVNILLFLSFLLFFLKAIRLKEKNQRNVYLAYSFFSLLFGFTRLFFLFAWMCGNTFEGCQDSYLVLGYLTGLLGMNIIIFILETYLLKTRKILTSLTFITFCIVLIALFQVNGREIALNSIYILLPVVFIAITISYIYFIIKSIGQSRKKAIGVFIGLVLLFVGHSMNTSMVLSIFPELPSIISPIVMFIGILLFTISQIFIK